MKNTGTLKVTTPTDREIVMTRVFDAPRRLVFDAFSKPDLLKRWFGPRGWSLAVCEVDFKVGGSVRFVLRGPDGKDMGMRGVYREIVPPERSVHMESFDDYPGESQVTSVLVEQDGKTTLTVTVLYPSQEVRDIVIKSGMEHGAAETYDKLANCWQRAWHKEPDNPQSWAMASRDSLRSSSRSIRRRTSSLMRPSLRRRIAV
jgi:uncharacterized protein YndB with AHSA1/START domain